MGSSEQIQIASTDKAINLNVILSGEPTLDEMEELLGTVGGELGLEFSHITKLGAKRYAGNRHWHFKLDPKTKGCLDVTYWPPGPAMWITIRRSEPQWVHNHGAKLGPAVERRLQTGAKAGRRT